MKHLSHWANRHVWLAIPLLIACEVANGFGAVLLGTNALSGLPLPVVLMLTVLVVAGAVGLHSRAVRQWIGATYRAQRRLRAAAFGSNYLLFLLLGGYWGHTVQTPSTDGSAWGSRRVVVKSDTLINPSDSVRKPVIMRDADGTISSRPEPSHDTSLIDRQRGRRVAYFSLFLLGFVLTFVAATVSCSIACSGYGALAALTFALGLGFLSGGIYFLGRAIERPFVPLRDQPIAQRRRTVRRFWLPWLILVGIFSVSLLTCGR